jgi:hypothetical protein
VHPVGDPFDDRVSGRSFPAKTAMTAKTTSRSIRVKALRRTEAGMGGGVMASQGIPKIMEVMAGVADKRQVRIGPLADRFHSISISRTA